MSKIKNELEELAFKYLEPPAYEALRIRVERRRRATEGMIEELKKTVSAKLAEAQVPVIEIDGRIKRLFSIHQKLKRQKIELDQVYDMVALRIVTESVKDCYGALGIIHQTWSPVPGRIKDFIAMPRPNGYQSLHTSVISERGVPFEVQIRTADMHRTAEEGIAAHWKYKEGRVGAGRDEQYFVWLRQLLEWQQEVRDPQEFLQNLKIELYPEEVYIFTPQGEVKSLPRDATPVDFAYSIHTDVGHQCVGRARERQDGAAPRAAAQRRHRRDHHDARAQAEPRLAELRRHLAGAEQDQALHPRRREGAQPRARAEAVRQGSEALRPQSEDADRAGDDGAGAQRVRDGQGGRALRRARLRQAVGEDRARAASFRRRSSRKRRPRAVSPRSCAACSAPAKTRSRVHGIDDLMVFRARCCNPIRGEKIVGYITRGKGVSVHSADVPERAQPALRSRSGGSRSSGTRGRTRSPTRCG